MTVKELKQELGYYDDDAEVVFEFNNDVSVDSWTEDKWGNKSVHISTTLEPSFICQVNNDCHIDLEESED